MGKDVGGPLRSRLRFSPKRVISRYVRDAGNFVGFTIILKKGLLNIYLSGGFWFFLLFNEACGLSEMWGCGGAGALGERETSILYGA